MSTNVAFFEPTPFSLPSIVTSPEQDDDLLAYYVSLPVPTPASILIKPLITQLYSRHQNPPVSSPTLAASTLDPVSRDYLPIALRKGCVHPIFSFCSYSHLSSHSYYFIASLDSISLPNTVHKALSHLGCHSAMVEEMQTLDDNGTWNLVQLPVGKKAIGYPWFLQLKLIVMVQLLD